MARRKKTGRRKAATAIVVRQPAPVVVRTSRRRRAARAIVGHVRRARANPAAGRAMKQVLATGVAAGAGALMAWGVQGEKIPQRIAGVESNFVFGAALSLIPVFVPGTIGRIAGDAGAGFAAISAYKLTLGTNFYSKDASGWDGGDSGY